MEKKINKELYRHSNIVIRLLGHTGWMAEHRHAKRALLEGDGGKRKKEWLEAVTTDLRMLGVPNRLEESITGRVVTTWRMGCSIQNKNRED
jgi:hypothetical protein